MEDVEFSCTSCRSSLSASKSDYGELVQCPSCNHTMKVPRYGVVAGMKLGDFKVLKCLGVGGMGEVWLAEQESLQRRVALKILSPEISNDESFINRFNQEVKIAGKLIHPNIVVAFHAGEQNGIRYLTSAYVDGLVASEALEQKGKMEQAEVLKIGRDIAKGLKYAWEKAHILHRDVKPDNIMLGKDGTPMLMDMGISKNFDDDVSLTMTGEIIGTPNYISPEQAHAADDIDFRADQYSLGATLFHLLTGQLPYQATSAMGILAQHLQDPVPDPQKYNSAVTLKCSKMIQKMMSKKPEDRYQSWDEFIVNANSLLPPEMRDGTMLPGTLTVPKKGNIKPIVIGALAGMIVISILIATFIALKQLKRKSDNEPKITRTTPDEGKKVPTVAGNSKEPEKPTTDRRPLKKPDKDLARHRDRNLAFLKSRFTTLIQGKFGTSESDAGKLADKWIKYHSKKKEIATANYSATEHRKKWQEELELEPLRKDLMKTANEVLGEQRRSKFEEFIKNEMGKGKKPNKGFGGRRREQ